MHILVTGAAGMIGRKLVESLTSRGPLGGARSSTLTLIDVVAPARAGRGQSRCAARVDRHRAPATPRR